MPLDVLKQLQEASSNVDNEQLKQSLDNVMQKASQSSESMNALRGIMSALTQGGQELSGSLEKVVYYFERFEQRSNAAKNALMGLGSSFSSLDIKPLQQIQTILGRIQAQQQALSNKIDMFPSVEKSIKQLQKVYDELSRIQKTASKDLDINVNYSGAPKIQKAVVSGQSFSSGGKVQGTHSYKPSNTRKAKTGGQFTGKRSGDRQIAFVNAGQAIITERAVKSGARQAGMSIGAYINNLNSGNISKIKRGRSFATGGGTGDISSLQNKYKRGKIQSNKDESQINQLIQKFQEIADSDDDDNDVANQILDKLKNANKKQQRRIVGYMEQSLNLKDKNLDTSNLKDILPTLREISDQLDQMGDVFEENSKKIKTFGDYLEANLQDASDQIDRAAKKLGNFGQFLVDSNTKAGAFAAGMIKISTSVFNASKKIMDFSSKQTELNKKLAGFNATGNMFGNVDMVKFRDEMNLTRQQASQLSDTFRTIGIEGNMSFGQIETIAKGIKEQFGQLDTSLLQQAIKQVKDLPKQQIDVLIKGSGSADDQFNLIANLMKDNGKLQATAQIIAKGGFGQVKGVTPQLSQGDKKTLQAHAVTNQRIDSINAFLNNMLPSQLVGLAGITTVLGTVVGIGVKSMAIMSGIANTTAAIATKMNIVGATNGKNNLLGLRRLPVGKIAGGATKAIGGLGKVVGVGMGKLLGFIAPMMGKLLAAVTGPIGLAVAAVIAVCQIWDKLANHRVKQLDKMAQEKITRRKQENQQEYGVYVDDKGVNSINTALKGFIHSTNQLLNPLNIITNLFSDLKSILWDLQNPLDVIKRRFRSTFAPIYQDARRNREAQAGKMTIRAAKRRKKLEEKINEKIGIKEKNIDAKKQVLLLASLNKRVKMIADGAYSRGNYALAQSANKKNTMISKIGGTDYNFNFNALDAIHNATEGLSKELIQSQSRIKQVFQNQKDGKISSNAAQVQITEIVNAQSSAYERMLKVLNENIAQYEKMPSVIQSSLLASLNNTINERKNTNFTGSIQGNVISANKILEKNSEAIKAITQKSFNDLEAILTLQKRIQQNNKQNIRMASDTAKNSNGEFQNIQNSDGSFNQQAHKDNLEQANKIYQEYQRKLNDASNSGRASDLKNIGEKIQSNISDFQSLNKQASNMEKDKLKGTEGENLTEKYNQRIENMIENLKKAKKGASKEESEEIESKIKALSETKEKINKYRSEGDKTQLHGEITTLVNLTQDSVDLIKQHQHSSAMKNDDFRKFYQAQGTKIGNAQRYIQASRAMSGAADAKNLSMNLVNEVFTDQIKAYEDGAKKFQQAIDLIHQSAEILYQNFRSEIARLSYSFDSAGNSRNAMNENVQSGFRQLEARKKALSESGNVVKQAQKKSADFVSTGLREILQKSNISKENADFYNEYARLQHNAGMLMSQNPQDEEGKKALAQAVADLAKFRKDNKDKLKGDDKIISAIDASSGHYFSVVQNQVKEMAKWKDDFVKQMNQVGEKFIQNVNNNANVMLSRSKRQQGMSIVQIADANVDMAGMKQAAKNASRLIGEGLKIELSNIDLSYNVSKTNLDKTYNEQRSKATNAEELLAIEVNYQNALSNLNAQYNKQRVEATKKAGQEIKKAYEPQIEAIGRKMQGLQIQKDLYASIGAPFEMVLQIEQQIVDVKRQEAEVEQRVLQDMIQKGANHKEIEKQKLKAAKAQANVLKAAFGAQRDSLDKMLGKMMGTFNQVGGIFGPDSERMFARKYGQGYSQNAQTGMIHTNDGTNAHNSYKERVFKNATIATGSRAAGANQMSQGHASYNNKWFGDGTDDASKAMKNTEDVIKTQNINAANIDTQRVAHLIVDSIQGGGIVANTGIYASKGGLVLNTGKIKTFSQGGPADPRDNIPSFLRRGQFVLTPEKIRQAIAKGKKLYQTIGNAGKHVYQTVGNAGKHLHQMMGKYLHQMMGKYLHQMMGKQQHQMMGKQQHQMMGKQQHQMMSMPFQSSVKTSDVSASDSKDLMHKVLSTISTTHKVLNPMHQMMSMPFQSLVSTSDVSASDSKDLMHKALSTISTTHKVLNPMHQMMSMPFQSLVSTSDVSASDVSASDSKDLMHKALSTISTIHKVLNPMHQIMSMPFQSSVRTSDVSASDVSASDSKDLMHKAISTISTTHKVLNPNILETINKHVEMILAIIAKNYSAFSKKTQTILNQLKNDKSQIKSSKNQVDEVKKSGENQANLDKAKKQLQIQQKKLATMKKGKASKTQIKKQQERVESSSKKVQQAKKSMQNEQLKKIREQLSKKITNLNKKEESIKNDNSLTQQQKKTKLDNIKLQKQSALIQSSAQSDEVKAKYTDNSLLKAQYQQVSARKKLYLAKQNGASQEQINSLNVKYQEASKKFNEENNKILPKNQSSFNTFGNSVSLKNLGAARKEAEAWDKQTEGMSAEQYEQYLSNQKTMSYLNLGAKSIGNIHDKDNPLAQGLGSYSRDSQNAMINFDKNTNAAERAIAKRVGIVADKIDETNDYVRKILNKLNGDIRNGVDSPNNGQANNQGSKGGISPQTNINSSNGAIPLGRSPQSTSSSKNSQGSSSKNFENTRKILSSVIAAGIVYKGSQKIGNTIVGGVRAFNKKRQFNTQKNILRTWSEKAKDVGLSGDDLLKSRKNMKTVLRRYSNKPQQLKNLKGLIKQGRLTPSMMTSLDDNGLRRIDNMVKPENFKADTQRIKNAKKTIERAKGNWRKLREKAAKRAAKRIPSNASYVVAQQPITSTPNISVAAQQPFTSTPNISVNPISPNDINNTNVRRIKKINPTSPNDINNTNVRRIKKINPTELGKTNATRVAAQQPIKGTSNISVAAQQPITSTPNISVAAQQPIKGTSTTAKFAGKGLKAVGKGLKAGGKAVGKGLKATGKGLKATAKFAGKGLKAGGKFAGKFAGTLAPVISGTFALADYNEFKNDPDAIARQKELTKYYNQKYGPVAGFTAEVLQNSVGKHLDVLNDSNTSIGDKFFAVAGLAMSGIEVPWEIASTTARRLTAGDGSEMRAVFGDDINETGRMRETEFYTDKNGVRQERFVSPSAKGKDDFNSSNAGNSGASNHAVFYGEKAALDERNTLARMRHATQQTSTKLNTTQQEQDAINKWLHEQSRKGVQQDYANYMQTAENKNTWWSGIKDWWSGSDSRQRDAGHYVQQRQLKRMEELKNDSKSIEGFLQQYRSRPDRLAQRTKLYSVKSEDVSSTTSSQTKDGQAGNQTGGVKGKDGQAGNQTGGVKGKDGQAGNQTGGVKGKDDKNKIKLQKQKQEAVKNLQRKKQNREDAKISLEKAETNLSIAQQRLYDMDKEGYKGSGYSFNDSDYQEIISIPQKREQLKREIEELEKFKHTMLPDTYNVRIMEKQNEIEKLNSRETLLRMTNRSSKWEQALGERNAALGERNAARGNLESASTQYKDAEKHLADVSGKLKNHQEVLAKENHVKKVTGQGGALQKVNSFRKNLGSLKEEKKQIDSYLKFSDEEKNKYLDVKYDDYLKKEKEKQFQRLKDEAEKNGSLFLYSSVADYEKSTGNDLSSKALDKTSFKKLEDEGLRKRGEELSSLLTSENYRNTVNTLNETLNDENKFNESFEKAKKSNSSLTKDEHRNDLILQRSQAADFFNILTGGKGNYTEQQAKKRVQEFGKYLSSSGQKSPYYMTLTNNGQNRELIAPTMPNSPVTYNAPNTLNTPNIPPPAVKAPATNITNNNGQSPRRENIQNPPMGENNNSQNQNLISGDVKIKLILDESELQKMIKTAVENTIRSKSVEIVYTGGKKPGGNLGKSSS